MDSAGGSELFESYEQDFEAIKVSINERITASGSQTGGTTLSTLSTLCRLFLASPFAVHLSLSTLLHTKSCFALFLL